MKSVMQLLLFIASLAAVGCSDGNFIDKTRIDGSILMSEPVMEDDTLSGTTVYIAMNFESKPENPLGFKNFGFCTGVIIAPEYILTAAHCAQNYGNSKVIFTNDAKAVSSVDRIFTIIHTFQTRPYVEKMYNQHDIAILKLDRPLPAEAKYDTNYFTSQSSTEGASTAIALGYGRNTDLADTRTIETRLNGYLQKAEIAFTSQNSTDRIISIDQKNKTGICLGDSGGPLFIRKDDKIYLQAISIAGHKTKSDDPENKYNECHSKGIYLNLNPFRAWISSIINSR